MAFVIADRVRETTTTAGTGAVTLAGAYTSFQTFSAAIGNGNNTYYTIASAVSGEWEVGIGTYTSAGNTLSRDTVLASSNAGALVVFSAGTKDVFVTQPASRAIFVQNGGTGLQTSNSAFTANRVLYANAATTTATSANLTFDGTNLGVGAASGTSSGYATAPQLLNYSASATNLLNASDTTSTIRSALYRDTTGGGIISMSKFRGTYASPTAAQSGDTSGRLWFEVWGGSNLRRIAEVGALVDTYTSDTNISGTLYFATSTSGNASSTEKMRLTAAGNLGINTTTPGYFLEIVNNNTASSIGLTRSSATARTWTMGIDGDGGYRLTDAGSGVVTLSALPSGITYLASQTELVFKYNSTTEGMRLTSTGLGIGTTSPSNRLDVFASADWQGRVVGNAGFNGGLIVEGNATGTRAQINLKTNNATAREYYLRNVSGTFSLLDNTAGTIPFTVEAATPSNTIYANASGNIGIGTTSPSNTAGFSRQVQIEGTTAALTLSGTTGTGKYTLGVPGVNAVGLWDNTASAYRWYVDSSGNLGIGTTSPGARLDVDRGSSNGFVARFGRTSGTQFYFYSDTSSSYLSTDLNLYNAIGFTPASNYINFYTNNAERMRLDSSGNLGLGVTPSAWGSGVKVAQVNYGALVSSATNNTLITSNCYYNGTQWIYLDSAAATIYTQSSGLHSWRIAGSGTAGNAITFTTAMTLDASGNLGIGTTSPGYRLHVAQASGNDIGFFGTSAGGGGRIVFSDGNSGTAASVPRIGANANDLLFYTNTSGNSATERMRLDSSGNLGFGVTPSAWSITALQIKNGSLSGGTPDTYLSSNANFTSGVWKYIASTNATQFYQNAAGGEFVWRTAASGTAGNTISFTQAMTLDASGNLLVGAASGSAVSGSATVVAVRDLATSNLSSFKALGGAAVTQIELFGAASTTGVWTSTNHPMLFATNNTERARITSGGDLLVGTTNAASSAGNGAKILANGAVYSVTSSSVADSYDYYNTTAGAYRFYVTNAGTINATNTTISAISDRRLKENISDLDVGLDAIMALKPRKFDWKEGKGKDIKNDRGFIAQEFEQVFPDLIDTWKDPAPEGEEPYKSVRQDLIPVLVKAIQELKAELDALKGA